MDKQKGQSYFHLNYAAAALNGAQNLPVKHNSISRIDVQMKIASANCKLRAAGAQNKYMSMSMSING